MQLFLVAAVPLFFVLVIALPWDRGRVPPRLALVSTFLKGLLLFFPAWLVVLLVRRVVGFSYAGLGLYVSLLVRDHLAPVLAAVAGFMLVRRFLPGRGGGEEETWLSAFAFLAGFTAHVNLADLVRQWGVWTFYDLFLLPILRLAALLAVPWTLLRFSRWLEKDWPWALASAAGAAAVLAVPSFLFRRSLPVIGIVGAAACLAAAVVMAASRFPRAARGVPISPPRPASAGRDPAAGRAPAGPRPGTARPRR